MKIVVEDFYYKDRYFKRHECEMPNVTNADEVVDADGTLSEEATNFIIETLDAIIAKEENECSGSE